MIQSDFLECIRPLIERFGDSKFPNVLTDSLYKKFGKEKKEHFAEVCDYLLCESKSAPVLSDFYNALRLIKPAISSAEKVKDNKFCSWCDQSGVVWAYTREEKRRRTFFRCQCWRGESSIYNVDQWNHAKHLKDYSMETYLDCAIDKPQEMDFAFVKMNPEQINQLLNGTSFKMPIPSKNEETDDELPF